MNGPTFAPGDPVRTPAGHLVIVIEINKRGELTVQYTNGDRASFKPKWLKRADVCTDPTQGGP